MKIMRAVLMGSAIGLAVQCPASGGHTAELLIGNWSCDSGPCSDEEIAFSIEDGKPTYNSWLHERPSASGGTWQLNGDRLLVECCAGLSYEWEIVAVTDKELAMRESGASEDTVFKRIGP